MRASALWLWAPGLHCALLTAKLQALLLKSWTLLLPARPIVELTPLHHGVGAADQAQVIVLTEQPQEVPASLIGLTQTTLALFCEDENYESINLGMAVSISQHKCHSLSSKTVKHIFLF